MMELVKDVCAIVVFFALLGMIGLMLSINYWAG